MEQAEMRTDPIVGAVRQVREAHAKKFGYDLEAIVRDLKKHERQAGSKVVSFPPKRLAQQKGAA